MHKSLWKSAFELALKTSRNLHPSVCKLSTAHLRSKQHSSHTNSHMHTFVQFGRLLPGHGFSAKTSVADLCTDFHEKFRMKFDSHACIVPVCTAFGNTGCCGHCHGVLHQSLTQALLHRSSNSKRTSTHPGNGGKIQTPGKEARLVA